MGKRFFCLICAAILMAASICGVRAAASAWKPFRAAPSDVQTAQVRQRVHYKPNALVSAMFLVLAGVSLTMLFDKKG